MSTTYALSIKIIHFILTLNNNKTRLIYPFILLKFHFYGYIVLLTKPPKRPHVKMSIANIDINLQNSALLSFTKAFKKGNNPLKQNARPNTLTVNLIANLMSIS